MLDVDEMVGDESRRLVVFPLVEELRVDIAFELGFEALVERGGEDHGLHAFLESTIHRVNVFEIAHFHEHIGFIKD